MSQLSNSHSFRTPLQRLRALIEVEASDLWVVVIYGVVSGLLALAVPLAVQALVNIVAFGSLLQPVVVLTLAVTVGLGFAALMLAIQTRVVERLQERIFVRMAADVAYRLPRLQLDQLKHHYTPELVNRFFDVLVLQKGISSLLLDGLAILLQVVIGMMVLAFYHPVLLAFDLALLTTLAGVIFVLGRNATATSLAESKAKYAVVAWLEDLARHPFLFKTPEAQKLAMARTDTLSLAYLKTRRLHFRVLFRQIVGFLAIYVGGNAVLLGLGGWLVIQRQLTLGQLVASELIVSTIVAGVAKFGKHFETFYDVIAALDKLGHLTDLPIENTADKEIAPRLSTLSLRLEGVRIQMAEGLPPLAIPSLNLGPSSRVGVAGPSGAGKSIFLEMIYATRSPLQGSVSIDGLDAHRDMVPASLRKQMALVRDGEIFEGSLLENLRLGGSSDLSLVTIRELLSRLRVIEAIDSLPQGLHTAVLPDGAPLSTGHVRMLCLARALLRQPRLLLVDGLLDGLSDPDRAAVTEVLFANDAPWALLLVTHRDDLLARCDTVIRLGAETRALFASARRA